MEIKKCSKCKKIKPLDEFAKNKVKKDGYGHNCLVCQRLYIKAHYEANKKYYSEKARKREKANAEWFKKYKNGLSCLKCGENHPACLDFHHRDPNKKESEISRLIQYCSLKNTIKEINKCDVLCSNCHRKLHAK